MKIKALTLWQPWASLMALEEKKIETRSWLTKHRGLLAIHAAKRNMTSDEISMLSSWKTAHGINVSNNPDHFPYGEIVAVVNLLDCKAIPRPSNDTSIMLYMFGGLNESLFGHYAVGRFAWITRMVYAVPAGESYPATGHQALWDWDVPIEIEKHLQDWKE